MGRSIALSPLLVVQRLESGEARAYPLAVRLAASPQLKKRTLHVVAHGRDEARKLQGIDEQRIIRLGE